MTAEKSELLACVSLNLARAKSQLGDAQSALAIRDFKALAQEIAEACEKLETAFNATSNLYAITSNERAL